MREEKRYEENIIKEILRLFIQRHINLRWLFNTKTIFVEEQ